MPEAKKIFISHIADESADAARAKEVLEKSFGTRVELFLASSWESIPPGEDWSRSIENAIQAADVMIWDQEPLRCTCKEKVHDRSKRRTGSGPTKLVASDVREKHS